MDPVTIGLLGSAAIGAGTNAIGSGKQAKAAREQAQTAGTAQVFDSTNPILRQLAGQQTQFLSGVFGGNNPFAPLQSPLQGAASGAIGGAMGAPNAGAQTAGSAIGALQQILMGAQNPFPNMGTANPGQAVVDATMPLFQRNLQAAQTQLAGAAPGRFSSAFVQQGQGLAQNALQDFNLFAANALQQGQALQNQQQSQALNFLLGAQGNQLGAAQGLGQIGALQGSLQNDAFSRLLGAGQFGLQQSQGMINPILQLLQSGLQYAQPADLNTIVGARDVRGLPAPGGYSQQLIPTNAMNPLALFGGR